MAEDLDQIFDKGEEDITDYLDLAQQRVLALQKRVNGQSNFTTRANESIRDCS
jgi:hypothetical protein